MCFIYLNQNRRAISLLLLWTLRPLREQLDASCVAALLPSEESTGTGTPQTTRPGQTRPQPFDLYLRLYLESVILLCTDPLFSLLRVLCSCSPIALWPGPVHSGCELNEKRLSVGNCVVTSYGVRFSWAKLKFAWFSPHTAPENRQIVHVVGGPTVNQAFAGCVAR